jgi:hypothetical protein
MEKWKRKKVVHSNMSDMYEFYKSNYKNPVSKSEFIKVCLFFNRALANKIITESFEFRMPYRLGKLRIKTGKQKLKIKDGKLDTKKMPIDWNTTKSVWREMYPGLSWDKNWNILSSELKEIPNKKLVFHTNEHNNGYINRWYWDRTVANVKNYTAYVFKPVKGGIMDDEYYCGKRGLAAWIKNDERTNEYFE